MGPGYSGLMRVAVAHIDVVPLNVPLLEPFVIASGRMDATRAVLVRATLSGAQGVSATGLGEAASLPPVTSEDQPDVLVTLAAAANSLVGAAWASLPELSDQLDALGLATRPVARAGLECALLDAWAQLAGLPLCTLLTKVGPRTLHTDITLPIAAPEHMLKLALRHHARGFRVFKVKIGKSIADDLRALASIASQLPDARFRLDANAAFSAEQALWLLEQVRALGIAVECFEQPCPREDLAAMAQVTAATDLPIVADESVRTLEQLERVHAMRAATGVNLKLAKSGGVLSALRIGLRARELGMRVMCGGMVETRLGMSAMGHVACALGGADYVDLDTAFLLASDPFCGGYESEGAALTLGNAAGHGVLER